MASPDEVDRPDEPRREDPGEPSEASPKAPSWVVPTATMLVVVTVLVLGFFWPGFFVTKVFDERALETGVRSILTESYRVPNVTDVYCPSRQKVRTGRDFACIAQINGSPAQVRVMIRDDEGRYLVNRPN